MTQTTGKQQGMAMQHLEPAEVLSVRREAKVKGQREWAMILAYKHGMRASEVCNLRVDDLDLKNGSIVVDRLKGSLRTTQAVTEHQAEIKRCPISGDRVTASFPPRVTAPAQYGPRFRALLLYFSNQQFIPYHRLAQLCGLASKKRTVKTSHLVNCLRFRSQLGNCSQAHCGRAGDYRILRCNRRFGCEPWRGFERGRDRPAPV